MDRDTTMRQLSGPVLPLNIPYRDDDRVDYDTLEKYVDWLVRQHAPMIMLTYGSSEYDYLTDKEIYDITQVVGSAIAGRTLFLAAANYWPVNEVVRYSEFAAESGAVAVSVQPNWSKPHGVDELFAFHRDVAHHAPLPLLSYTLGVPGMPVELVKRFADELPAVIGFKNDSDQYAGLYNYLRAADGKLAVISGGQMRNILFGYQFGAPAYLCPFVPFAPWVSLDFFAHLSTGHLEAARDYTLRYEAPLLDQALAMRGKWLPFIKSVLYLRGLFPSNRMRLPGPTHNKQELDQIRAMLAKLEIPPAPTAS